MCILSWGGCRESARNEELPAKIRQRQNRNLCDPWSESKRRKRGIFDVVAASVQLKYPAPSYQTLTFCHMLRYNANWIGEFGFAAIRPEHFGALRSITRHSMCCNVRDA